MVQFAPLVADTVRLREAAEVYLPDPTSSPVPVPDPFQDVDALEELEEEIVILAAHSHAADHRLLVLAARVIPSSYHVVVVVDPMPWVNAVRGELWRSAVVRASVGRTAVWLTPDRDLASRASHVVEYRQGALRRAQGPANSEF